VRVDVRTIDDVLLSLGIFKVDFIKLDVEGAELSVLRGATGLLQGPSRPAILAEVQDLRTHPWGYAARDIFEFLVRMNYRWFSLAPDSSLTPIATNLDFYDANLVALPSERVREFRSILERSRVAPPHAASPSHRNRGIEILKSMVRVRQA
jgi:methyltransferase FkbM-like protein